MNREYSFDIVKILLEWGVAEFYVCAGARNFPLVETVLGIQSKTTVVFNHFEERSAAFYALGRIKLLKKPIAVITTSGTAVGELLPAVMEAYYSGLPLVLITGDRPRSYRGTGAPQTAEQSAIFGSYVSKCIDLQYPEKFKNADIEILPKTRPLHINVCFDVPLQSGILKPIQFVKTIKKTKTISTLNHKTNHVRNLNVENGNMNIQKFQKFLKKSNHILVIVAQIVEDNKSNLISFLMQLNCPVYFESISNLRECKELSHLKIYCADEIWKNAGKCNFKIDSVIKIGGTPTHRVWRDLDETRKEIRVFSIGEHPFSGMPNAEHVTTDLNAFFGAYLSSRGMTQPNREMTPIQKFLAFDKISHHELQILLQKHPNSEQSFVYHLSKKIGKNARVFLGNSLPIRYWDLTAVHNFKNLIVNASRGLNGIDGQISTFLGFASETTKENWGIFGDLTTLYDLAGPWMLQQRPHLNVNIVIINNSGGRIFQRILKGSHAKFCQNTHSLEFRSFAKMWGLHYKKITSLRQIKNLRFLSATKQYILELVPNFKQTTDFNHT